LSTGRFFMPTRTGQRSVILAGMCSRTAFSRPRPVVFKAKAKAKDLEAKVEASDFCDEG